MPLPAKTPRHRRSAAGQLSVLLLLLLLAATSPHAAPADPGARADTGWILAKLARPAPMRTAFVELRGSPLLRRPLRLEGEYRRPDEATLVREVTSPYPETTTIRAGEVAIAREGRPVRRFALARTPELGAVQASFGALLAGDRRLLERHYFLDTQGTRQRWTMTLLPRDAALAQKLQAIVLYGRGAELRCIETQPAGGEVQRTLLAGAAGAARGITGAGALAALCYGGPRAAAPVAPPQAPEPAVKIDTRG